MYIDLHAHSSGISRCCQIPAPEVLKVAKDVGLDGIVLTNHYQKYYVENGDAAAFAKKYTDEFRYTKRCGEELGMTVIYGMEITMHRHDDIHMLLYGIDESFTEAYPTVYDMTQKELYALAVSHGGILVQAHPFRGSNYPLDPSLLHGYELNCHPGHCASRYDDVTALAIKHDLILTCGGDYHADSYRACCGVILPDTVTDSKTLATYLKSTDSMNLIVHEPENGKKFSVTYSRSNKALNKEEL